MKFFITKSANFLIILLLLAVCLFSACAKEEGSKRATIFDVFGITDRNPDVNTKEIVFTDDFVWERSKNQSSDSEEKTVGSDGSQIIRIKDAFGNTTYQRTFSNDPRLDRIMIVSDSDGKQIVYLYGKGGAVVRIADETKENFLQMSVADLADRADLRQPIKESSFDEPKIRSSLPVENAAVPNQPQPDYSQTYNNDFPNINENNPLPPAQTKSEDSGKNQPSQPQITDNN